MADHLEARRLPEIVRRRHVDEHVEGEFRLVAERLEHLGGRIARNHHGRIADVLMRIDDALAEHRPQPGDQILRAQSHCSAPLRHS
jgi:hypothetical protein